MKSLIFILLLVHYYLSGFTQTNVALLHQLVDNSKSEHARQVELRGQQTRVSGYEAINSVQTGKLKDTYRNVQKKFSSLGLAIEAVEIGLEALPLVSKIAQDEQLLISLCRQHPVLFSLVISSQIDLADRAQMLLRYLYGLSLSIQDLNAMSRSDRIMLSSFVVDELRVISLTLSGMIRTISASKRKTKFTLPLFGDAVRRDKQIISDILSRVKQLK